MRTPSFSSVLSTVAGCAVACAFSTSSPADSVTIGPSADTSLIQNSDNANGGSTGVFAGQTNIAGARRALIRFDVANAVPAGATITGALLQMSCVQSTSDLNNFSLHRVTGAWNEGTANGSGSGAPASNGDTTWLYRVYNINPGLRINWASQGGDFIATPSASTPVGFPGPYAWGSTQGMVDDVQTWLDNPGSNNGWLIKAVSEVIIPTAKRFASREFTLDPSIQPKLTIEYSVPTTCNSIDFNNDNSFFDPQDIDAFLSVFSEGPCVPDNATCDGIDFNNDGSLFDPCDIDAFLLVFSEGPCTLCGN